MYFLYKTRDFIILTARKNTKFKKVDPCLQANIKNRLKGCQKLTAFPTD